MKRIYLLPLVSLLLLAACGTAAPAKHTHHTTTVQTTTAPSTTAQPNYGQADQSTVAVGTGVDKNTLTATGVSENLPAYTSLWACLNLQQPVGVATLTVVLQSFQGGNAWEVYESKNYTVAPTDTDECINLMVPAGRWNVLFVANNIVLGASKTFSTSGTTSGQ